MTLTRFAPSPTGHLHVGNVRVALVNWLHARARGGRFLLRLDDTDTERSTAAFADAIQADLRWLGLTWDAFARQSDRLDHYAAAAERLRADGRLYPCYETAEELGLKRKHQLASGRPPVYDRAALKLSEADRRALEAEGRQPHWRFRLEDTDVAWDDLVRGPVHFAPGHLSDPVLIRADGRPLYTLSSVVDDLELGVSDVIRGEDHVANTAVQVQLFQALGGRVPIFAHLALLTGAQGEGLSKRLGSAGLAAWREEGLEPVAVAALLARLGSADPVVPVARLDDLVAGFDLTRFGRAPAKFDPEDLRQLNGRILHHAPYDAVAPRLAELGLAVDRTFWAAVQGNLTRLADLAEWQAICAGPVTPVVDDADFLAAAADLLPPEPWTPETWKTWTTAVREATGRKGKALFLPLRHALTGRDHGPELRDLLPLIGRERVLARLRGEAV